MTRRILRTGLATTVLAAGITIASPAIASADIVDDALAALPSGQITCEQAGRYWTDEADYNSKVAQARALALFDSRGPQIQAALARIDEAANRCGLKGGGAPAQPVAENPAPSQNNQGGNGGNTGGNHTPSNLPAPIFTVPTPAGTPTFVVDVPGVGGVQLPDLLQIVKNFFAQFRP